MNLTERAEIRKETFYKLTNSRDVPEAPSVGGRNLLSKTNQGKKNWSWVFSSGGTTAEDYNVDGINAVKLTRTSNDSHSWQYIGYWGLLRKLIEPDTKYTLSFDTNPNVDVTFTASLKRGDSGATLTNVAAMNKATGNQWNKISCVLTSKTTLPDDLSQIVYFSGMPSEKGNWLIAKNIKLEKGETATPYSVAPEDLGWTMDMLVPTPTQRYLWKFDYIYYSDGSVENTQPVNISIAGADGAQGPKGDTGAKGEKGDKGDTGATGPQGPKGDKGATGDRGPQGIQGIQGPKGDQGIQGPKGADGKTQYTHIAYADNATGGGFSQTDQTKAYIGMYVDFNATDSTDPTKYRWSKWHGDKGATGAQGIQGPKGADGRTPYLHIAYANSADGRTDFSTSNSGNKRYLGTYTDYTQTDSTDPTKYKWVDMVGTVKVGGRNLAQKTSKDWSKPFTGFSGIQNTCPNLYKVITDGLVVGDTLKTRIVLKYTDIKPVSGKTAEIWIQGAGNVTAWNSGAYPSGGGGRRSLSGSGEAVFELTDKINADHLKNDYWSWAFRTDWIASGSLEWKEAKVEAGTVFSKWSPALEDTQEQIDSKADQTLTQEQLNALAEKNSIIKAEMEAKASIDTVNQWITAYQNYVNANDEARAESEKNLQEAAARILQLKTDVGALRQQWDFIDTYISIQNEGLIIGKSDGSAFAKFANDRISLFSGSSEVMYISQGTLHIENGIFTKTIQIGRFRFETHPADKDMLVLRYLGG